MDGQLGLGIGTLTFWKACCSFWLSDSPGDESRSSSAVGESSSSVSRWVGSRYGSISYSPVSQMSRLPVDEEAVSIR